MTPKEKAKQLFIEKTHTKNPKKAAWIHSQLHLEENEMGDKDFKYWKKVQQEIEKL